MKHRIRINWFFYVTVMMVCMLTYALLVSSGNIVSPNLVALGNVCAGNIEIDVYVDYLSLEPMRAVKCLIYKNGSVFIPMTTIGYVRYVDEVKDTKLSALESLDGIIGIVEESNPNIVLFLFSKETGEGWPFHTQDENSHEAYIRGKALLRSLSESFPDMNLTIDSLISDEIRILPK